MSVLPRRLPKIKRSRIAWLTLQVVLVFFSSTRIAGQAAEYAFQFYRALAGLGGGPGSHLLAEKGVHFVLFFSLGVILFYSLDAPVRERAFWVLAACLLVGACSEGLQFLSRGRHPSLADVALNAISGLLGAIVLALNKSRSADCELRT
jgi:VanZ family protein